MSEIRVESNRVRNRLKTKWIEVIEEDMRECGANEIMVNYREVSRGDTCS